MKNLLIVFMILETSRAWAQISVPFTSAQWKFETKDYAIEEYMGKASVRLKQNRATFQDANFENGIIEYDIVFPPGRAFIGGFFRLQDNANYEEFYVRTHQSGNPDANQYSPVFNGLAAWQLYYGEGYGAPVQYAFNTWIHVKLVVSGDQLEVYLNDMEKPVLFSQLKRPAQKGGLAVQNFLGESHFANFTYTPQEKPTLKSTAKPLVPAPAGTITQWEISAPLAEASLQNLTSLKSLKPESAWKKVNTENTGLLNLAGVSPWSRENNTVFVRIIVDSDKDQVKKFTFGFSDRVRVYLNDVILYSGEDNYLSRDYRFLGTIGYFDSAYLNLKKGRNEIRLALSENMGGWGIKGKFDDMEGITIR